MVYARISLRIEILHPSLAEYEKLTATEEDALLQHFQSRLFGSKDTEVKSSLGMEVFEPSITVDANGLASRADMWAAVVAAVSAYNAIDTGLQIQLPPAQPTGDPPPYHCVTWVWRDGERVPEYNWSVTLVNSSDGSVERATDLSENTSVTRQVLGMGHVTIEVPKAL